MSFQNLKKTSRTAIDSLQSELSKLNKGADSYKDDRFWKPTLDKASNGFAVIRFLAAPEGEDIPWVRQYSHGFQGKGGWFIENCPTTIGGKCPVCEANNDLWNSGVESDKKIARDRKRKLSYISNIYVVSDPSNPSSEGKVFLFKYGKSIFDLISAKMNPEFPDEQPVNPFDFWTGANFKMKIRKVDGYINYERSEFASPEPLLGGDDAKLEKLWKTQYSLKEFVAPAQFKSYNELQTKMNTVLNTSRDVPATAEGEDDDEMMTFSPKFEQKEAKAQREAAAKSFGTEKKPSAKFEPEEEDDAMSYFKRLAED
jgi:hypothetical protein